MPKTLLFIGDSLTEWFDWQARFPEQLVQNLGVAGETVEGLLARLGRMRTLVRNPDMIFLMTGVNNIAMGDHGILRTYERVVETLRRDYPKAVLVIQSILPVSSEWIAGTVIPRINEGLHKLARDSKAEYLDVYHLFIHDNGDPKTELLLDDGVHLSNRGYVVWSGEVERFIKK